MKTSRSFGKALFSLGLFAGLSAAPSLALADTDSYVEVQFDARLFGDLLLRQISTASSFCPQPTVLEGREVYADHLEFPHEGVLSRADLPSMISINDRTEVESTRLLYIQPVDVHLKTVECAEDPECSATTAVSAELTYVLYTTPSSQICMKGYDARGLPPGVDLPDVQVCLPFDARSALKAAGLSGEGASGSAVSMDPGGERVALRVELGRTADDYDRDRIDAWQAFADGELERTGASGDWSVFLHKSLILGAVDERLSAALESQASLSVDGPIATSWEGGERGGRVEARLNGALSTTLCPDRIRVNDITFTAKIAANDPDAPTGLLTYGSVSYDVSNADAAACGLSLGGPLGGLVLGSLADAIKVDLTQIGRNCRSDGDFDFECEETTHPQIASVGPLQALKSSLSEVVGSGAGLAMNGAVKLYGVPAPTLKAEISDFRLDEGTGARESDLRLQGTARLCGATFRASDPHGDVGLLNIDQPRGAGLPARIHVSLPHDHVDAYASHPFRLLATVMTSAGVRTYSFDSPL